MIYNENQLLEIAPLIKHAPKWFVLGGPADGNEAQCAATQWPGINILAVEPYGPNIDWQLANGFPKNARILQFALGSKWDRNAVMYAGNDAENGHRCSSLSEEANDGNRSHIPVEVITLDLLSAEFGPFTDAFLWLDIEGFELEALKGACELLERKAINYVNVETMVRNQTIADDIHALLSGLGFDLIHTWNIHYADDESIHHCDKLYERTQ